MCSSLVSTEIPISQELQALADNGAKAPVLFIIKEVRASERFVDFFTANIHVPASYMIVATTKPHSMGTRKVRI
jgi:hypothetical protein